MDTPIPWKIADLIIRQWSKELTPEEETALREGSPPKKVTKSFIRKSSQEKDSTTSANKRQNTITGRNIKLFVPT